MKHSPANSLGMPCIQKVIDLFRPIVRISLWIVGGILHWIKGQSQLTTDTSRFWPAFFFVVFFLIFHMVVGFFFRPSQMTLFIKQVETT